MTEAATLCLRKSRIPHLAFSISAKRAAGQPSSRCSDQQLRSSLSRSRYYTAFSPVFARTRATLPATPSSLRRHASTIERPSSKLPNFASQTPQKKRPTLAQLAAAQEALRQHRTVESRKRFAMSSNTYFWICSLFGFVVSTYIMYTYMSYSRALKEYENLDLPQNADVSSRWMDMSRNFDDEVELSEKAMFLRSKRESLCRDARGNVLEVSAGTGRNMDLYRLDPALVREDKRVKSLVINDLSEIMLYQAQKKFDALQDDIADEKRKFPGMVKFVVGDAGDKRLIKRPEGGFDTIVQTMGICSETHPVAFLKRLGELCRQPGEHSTGLDAKVIESEAVKSLKDLESAPDRGFSDPESEQFGTLLRDAAGDLGGKILLLEHGRSKYGVINQVLDNGAKMHADHYGCWWNKDIEEIIKDSGLIVERKRRYHFGTTYEYVLRPSPKTKGAQPGSEATEAGGTAAVVNLSGSVKAKRTGWFTSG